MTHPDHDQDYVLGTHDEELQRLGLQHRVWRSRMLDAWAKAGITEGSRVVDMGCGPGYATIDLAEIVGPRGEVLAIERSTRFLDFANAACQRRGLTNVRTHEADLTGEIVFAHEFDALWCRWVASFVTDIAQLVRHVSSALRPGGHVIFHEYVNYATFRTVPHVASFEAFVTEVMASWREAGGEPDIATTLLPTLATAGFEIVDTTPIMLATHPTDFAWHWPRSFILSHPKRLVESGRVTVDWATQVQQDFIAFERSPTALILTPTVLQIIARKR
jgi:SAM-dependent methyltransferase